MVERVSQRHDSFAVPCSSFVPHLDLDGLQVSYRRPSISAFDLPWAVYGQPGNTDSVITATTGAELEYSVRRHWESCITRPASSQVRCAQHQFSSPILVCDLSGNGQMNLHALMVQAEVCLSATALHVCCLNIQLEKVLVSEVLYEGYECAIKTLASRTCFIMSSCVHRLGAEACLPQAGGEAFAKLAADVWSEEEAPRGASLSEWLLLLYWLLAAAYVWLAAAQAKARLAVDSLC